MSRWKEYLDDLLNFINDMEAELRCIIRGGLRSERRRGRGYISEEDMLKAV